MLRHSKAMHLLEAGVNIVYIRDILGHVDVSTTEVYARANMAMKQAALEKVSHISAGAFHGGRLHYNRICPYKL